MINIIGIELPLIAPEGILNSAFERALGLTGILPGEVQDYRLARLSYDVRHRMAHIVCSVRLSLNDDALEQKMLKRFEFVRSVPEPFTAPHPGSKKLARRPLIAGFGPCGMFAAYLLAKQGYRPIVLERGADVQQRMIDVQMFWTKGELNSESNVQFGAGGAGTFSDGKLTTRVNDPLCEYVTKVLCEMGAPEDICYRQRPHIGSDRLGSIVTAMQNSIVEDGGEILYNRRLDDLIIRSGELCGAVINGQFYESNVLLLCCGHSARDTFETLMKQDLTFVPKPFSAGLRIEHLQSDIDNALYGSLSGDPRLPKGEYMLSCNIDGCGVYTFCMCPGGNVVAAASEPGGIVTNGMSLHARSGVNANSALAVSVSFPTPQEGIEFQRRLERQAYEMTGGYSAPAQDLGSFTANRAGLRLNKIQPTYPLGVREARLDKLLGDELSGRIALATGIFGSKIRGFDDGDALLCGPESRTSSPLRMERDSETRQAPNAEGLYPCGEGAGYAGGIMSAAVDGLKSAIAVIQRYRQPESDALEE